jgi:hypothetical protein
MPKHPGIYYSQYLSLLLFGFCYFLQKTNLFSRSLPLNLPPPLIILYSHSLSFSLSIVSFFNLKFKLLLQSPHSLLLILARPLIILYSPSLSLSLPLLLPTSIFHVFSVPVCERANKKLKDCIEALLNVKGQLHGKWKKWNGIFEVIKIETVLHERRNLAPLLAMR